MILSFSHECGDSKINLSSAERVQRVDEIHTGSTLTGLLDSITRGLWSTMCSEKSFIRRVMLTDGFLLIYLSDVTGRRFDVGGVTRLEEDADNVGRVTSLDDDVGRVTRLEDDVGGVTRLEDDVGGVIKLEDDADDVGGVVRFVNDIRI